MLAVLHDAILALIIFHEHLHSRVTELAGAVLQVEALIFLAVGTGSETLTITTTDQKTAYALTLPHEHVILGVALRTGTLSLLQVVMVLLITFKTD